LKRTHNFPNLVNYKVTQAVVGEWYCSIPLFVPSVRAIDFTAYTQKNNMLALINFNLSTGST